MERADSKRIQSKVPMPVAHSSSAHSSHDPAAPERLENRTRALDAAPPASIRVGFGTRAEWRRTLDWLERGLRPGRPGRLRAEYPLLMQEHSSAIPIVLSGAGAGAEPEAGTGAPRSACMLWARELRVSRVALRVGMISLVYTDPEARGRGFARSVVRRAIAEAERRDLGIVLLWSEADALYRELGFVEAGAETALMLDRNIAASAIEARSTRDPARSPKFDRCRDPLRPTPPSALDWAEITRTRAQRTSTLTLADDEFARLRALPDMRALCLRDAGGGFGFAIRGRGDDLAEVIHEWGGDTELALRCCHSLFDDRGPDHELMLLSPTERSELGWALRSAGARVLRNPLAWFRIASPDALAADLQALDPALPPFVLERSPSIANTIGPRTTPPPAAAGHPKSRSPRISIESELGEATVSETTLLHGLLGAAREDVARDARSRLASVFGPDIEARWPLPLYVWGLESI